MIMLALGRGRWAVSQEPKLNQKFHAVVVQGTARNCIIKCAHVQSSFLFLYFFFFLTLTLLSSMGKQIYF